MNSYQILFSFLAAADDSPRWLETLVGFLPLAVFLILLYIIMRRFQKSSPVAQLQKKYLEQQLEQMPRIEALLERIAKALERHQ
jgi:hypothetical protein